MKNVVIHKVKQVYLNNLLLQPVEPANVPDPVQLQNYLNQVFGPQTNTWFTVTKGPDIVVDYDVGGDDDLYPDAKQNGRLDIVGSDSPLPGAPTTKEQAALGIHKTNNAIDIFYVKSLTSWNQSTVPTTKDDTLGGATRPNLQTIYMCDAAVNPLHDTAHEIGHQLLKSPDHTENPGDENRLMWGYSNATSLGIRLIKAEWDKINP